jgi:2-methylcitrate dehydratase PrpD
VTRLTELAQQAVDLRLTDAPPDVLERLRLQSLSVLGASAASLLAPDMSPLLKVAARSPGPHFIAPGVPGMSLDAALRAAAGLSVAMDYDDYLLCGHTGHTAHWVAWLGGASLGRDWKEVQRAQLAANELMGRLGGMCLAGRQNGQAWAFLHTFGAALVGGLLLRLSPARLANALAIALSGATFVDARTFHTGAKVLVAGEAAAQGWRAAELAEAGLDGPLDLLEDGSELLSVLAGGRPFPGWLTGIGRTWLTQTLTFKMVPGCAYLGSTVEAAVELLSEVQGLTAADVLRIDVDAGLLTAAMERLLGGSDLTADGTAGPLQPIGVNFSVARSLALLFARGSLGPPDLTLEALAEASGEAGTLSRRIHVHHDWRMTLAGWDSLRAGIGIDRLLKGLGPAGLLAAASRARGGVGAGTRTAWARRSGPVTARAWRGASSPWRSPRSDGGGWTSSWRRTCRERRGTCSVAASTRSRTRPAAGSRTGSAGSSGAPPPSRSSTWASSTSAGWGSPCRLASRCWSTAAGSTRRSAQGWRARRCGPTPRSGVTCAASSSAAADSRLPSGRSRRWQIGS